MRYLVQRTQNAFGPAETIPERAWRTVSEHSRPETAVRAMVRGHREMKGACGPNAWSCHYRVSRSDGRPIKQTDQVCCMYCMDSNPIWLDNGRVIEVRLCRNRTLVRM